MAEVAAPADQVRRHTLLLEGALEQREVGRRPQQHGHVAGLIPRAVEQLTQTLAQQPSLGDAPQDRARQRGAEVHRLLLVVSLPACAVGDEQLHQGGRPIRLQVGPAGAQRNESGSHAAADGGVDGVEQRLGAAEVRAQVQFAVASGESRPLLVEQLDVRVAEPVDGLEGVADHAPVVAVDGLEDLELHPVGVLELVHQHGVVPCAHGLREGRARAEQVAHHQLEVGEVHARQRPLRLGIPRPVTLEQLTDQRVHGQRFAIEGAARSAATALR